MIIQKIINLNTTKGYKAVLFKCNNKYHKSIIPKKTNITDFKEELSCFGIDVTNLIEIKI